jgi:formate dehydrogenase subunit beta
MRTHWMLRTNDDPLAAVRQFLAHLWLQAGLEGMLVPYYQTEAGDLMPYLVEDPAQLADADPFVPVTVTDSALYSLQLARERPGARLGVVLRSCEARALKHVAGRDGLRMDGWLLVGVDCLATYAPEDFGWRLQKAGRSDALTRANLRFARQGGLAAYRYRQACQMCAAPTVTDADLCIHLIGLPLKEIVLVAAGEGIVEKFRLHEAVSGLAPDHLIAQHDRALALLNERRGRFRERTVAALPDDLPGDADELIDFLADCAPCQRCLEACPIYAGELAGEVAAQGNGTRRQAVSQWLAACLGCGMCEEACPQHTPLVAIIERARSGLRV